MGHLIPLIAFILCVVLDAALLPQDAHADSGQSALLFEDDTPLTIEIVAPWRKISRDKKPKPAWAKATLALSDSSASDTNAIDANANKEPSLKPFNIEVQPRGRSRREKGVCDFPPLWLNFKRSEVAGTIFAGQNKLKLVTHCTKLGNRLREYSDRVHSEYLLYKILNQVTPLSFRVRAVNVTYVEDARRYTHPAFIIEHKTTLAQRSTTTLIKKRYLPEREQNADYAATMSLFAYFAGNTDFSFVRSRGQEDCCHNAVPLLNNDEAFAVPYDFDSTGFVDPPYAAPADELGITEVTTRLYRGYCSHGASLPRAIERFRAIQQDTLRLIEEYEGITKKRRKKLLRFTKRFYQVLDSPKTTQQALTSRCR